MPLMDKIYEQAKKEKKRILLPEGTEERTIEAAKIIAAKEIADIYLLGNSEEIEKLGGSGVTIIDPQKHEKRDEYIQAFFDLRKSKGISLDDAKKTLEDTKYYACMMIKSGDADGMVAGAVSTTADTLRPALQIIKTSPGIKIVSSCFIMELPNDNYGENGVLVFGDCAVNINPNAEELASIALSSADSAKALTGMEPRVAMLSFSTKGSASHELADKVISATALAQELNPNLMIDGELQADAALVESVGQLKSPGSAVAGKANVLIFPDLQAGNIGYKLVQRLAGAQAIGPICQGIAKPVNDLSRGCSVEDIVSVVAITAVQAQNSK